MVRDMMRHSFRLTLHGKIEVEKFELFYGEINFGY